MITVTIKSSLSIKSLDKIIEINVHIILFNEEIKYSTCVIPSPNPMFDHIGFGDETGIIEIKICTLSRAHTGLQLRVNKTFFLNQIL